MRWGILVVSAALLLAPCAAAQQQAQPAPATPLTGLYDCANITEDAARLQCFDQNVARLRAAESTGDIVAVDRGQVASLERESFGFQLPSLSNLIGRRSENAERVERIETSVERVITHGDGRHTFVLTNGQRWMQVQPQSASNVDPGDNIAIRRAAIGSFMLSPEHGAAHRVRRVE